jgi:protein-disulfide isomerase
MSSLKPSVNAADHQQGNIHATITLVEYGDFQCPHCRIAHPFIQKLLKEKGKEIHFVFRNFPLREIHPYAMIAALAAEAAGKQGKYWEMHDLIFEHQQFLNAAYLLKLAERLKLDLVQFSKDAQSEETENKVETDFDSGIRSGVNGTPTFFLNGSPVFTYDETYASLLDAVVDASGIKA